MDIEGERVRAAKTGASGHAPTVGELVEKEYPGEHAQGDPGALLPAIVSMRSVVRSMAMRPGMGLAPPFPVYVPAEPTVTMLYRVAAQMPSPDSASPPALVSSVMMAMTLGVVPDSDDERGPETRSVPVDSEQSGRRGRQGGNRDPDREHDAG